MTTITKKQAEAAERVCQELGYLDYYSPAQLRAYLDAYHTRAAYLRESARN